MLVVEVQEAIEKIGHVLPEVDLDHERRGPRGFLGRRGGLLLDRGVEAGDADRRLDEIGLDVRGDDIQVFVGGQLVHAWQQRLGHGAGLGLERTTSLNWRRSRNAGAPTSA